MCRSIAELERVQSTALRDVIETRGFGHRRCTDRAELVGQVETGRHRESDPAANTRPYRHILFAFDPVGDRVANDSGTQFPMPKNLSGVAVHRAEIAVQATIEDKTAVG